MFLFCINFVYNKYKLIFVIDKINNKYKLANCKSKSLCHLARHLKGQVGVDCLITSHWHFGHSGCHYSTKLDVNNVV